MGEKLEPPYVVCYGYWDLPERCPALLGQLAGGPPALQLDSGPAQDFVMVEDDEDEKEKICERSKINSRNLFDALLLHQSTGTSEP